MVEASPKAQMLPSLPFTRRYSSVRADLHKGLKSNMTV
jgi:hypothetical protein